MKYFSFVLITVPVQLLHCFRCLAKEVEVTKDWKLLGENDTIPAGVHVRMDMTTGEKWVKQMEDNNRDEAEEEFSLTTTATAVIQGDGLLVLNNDDNTQNDNTKSDKATPTTSTDGYDYEMMYRTLSKLPDKEKVRMGGLPELPNSAGGSPLKLTSQEREAFEKRMAEIWERRQAELKEIQELLLDLPEVLKDRVRSIKEYLKDPFTHLDEIHLGENNDNLLADEGVVVGGNILSVLEDLEFHLTDIDITRDFHTLGGWELLVSLLSEDVHVPHNKTISRMSRQTEAKIRAVQAQAAWAIGTAVKNTGEFFPYAVEEIKIGTSNDSSTKSKWTTAVDLLIEVFCKDYEDSNRWEVRTLLSKSVYGIGSLLRGNRMAQIHVLRNNGFARLGSKFRQLANTNGRLTSATTKLIQRLLSLASDIISDIQIYSDDELSMKDVNHEIIGSLTTDDWCESTSTILVGDFFLPIPVQETLLQTVTILGPLCDWDDKVQAHQTAIVRMQDYWESNKDDFEPEHWELIRNLATEAITSLARES